MNTRTKIGFLVTNIFSSLILEKKDVFNTLISLSPDFVNLDNDKSPYFQLVKCYDTALKVTKQHIKNKYPDIEITDIIPNCNDGARESLEAILNPLLEKKAEDFEALIDDYELENESIKKSDIKEIVAFLYEQFENSISSTENYELHSFLCQKETNDIVKNIDKKLDNSLSKTNNHDKLTSSIPTSILNMQKELKNKWAKYPTIIGFPLKDIYIDNIVNLYEIDTHNNKTKLSKNDIVKGTELLLDQLEDNPIILWYNDVSRILTGNIFVILGEPGHGKSSLCTSFYNKFNTEVKIIVIELNDIFFNDHLFNEKDSIDFALLFDTYTKNNTEILNNHIIILDGYDELSSRKNIIFKNFIDKLDSYIKHHLINTKFIVTSRRSYLKNEDICHIIKSGNHVGIIKPLEMNQQIEWITNYNRLINSNQQYDINQFKCLPNANENLYKITQIPIMFQLIVKYNNNKSIIKNKANLLEELLRKTTIDRESKLHNSLQDITIENLHKELENLAALIHCNYKGDDKQEIPMNDNIKQLEYCFYCIAKKDRVYFLHRSFYQHFLAYHIYNQIISFNSETCVQKFFQFFYLNPESFDEYLITNLKEIIEIESNNLTDIENKVKLMLKGLDSYYQSQNIYNLYKIKDLRSIVYFIIKFIIILTEKKVLNIVDKDILSNLFYHTLNGNNLAIPVDSIIFKNIFEHHLTYFSPNSRYNSFDDLHFINLCMSRIVFNEMRINNTSFENVIFDDIEFNHCLILFCDFHGCKYKNVTFNCCDMSDTAFLGNFPENATPVFNECILPYYLENGIGRKTNCIFTSKDEYRY